MLEKYEVLTYVSKSLNSSQLCKGLWLVRVDDLLGEPVIVDIVFLEFEPKDVKFRQLILTFHSARQNQQKAGRPTTLSLSLALDPRKEREREYLCEAEKEVGRTKLTFLSNCNFSRRAFSVHRGKSLWSVYTGRRSVFLENFWTKNNDRKSIIAWLHQQKF